MTTQQLHLFNLLYTAFFVVVAFATRTTARRCAGALAGGAAFGVFALGAIGLGEHAGLWRMAIRWEPYFLTLLYFDFVVSCAAIYLLTWRVARRFGRCGLAAVVAVAAVLGPVRDYRYLARFSEWGSYSPGVAPVLAIAATYVTMVVLGHGVMRLIAGPARSDGSRRPVPRRF